MRRHELAPPDKVDQLKADLNRYHHTDGLRPVRLDGRHGAPEPVADAGGGRFQSRV